MTTQQKQIIDALTCEFLRINERKNEKCYKLINFDELQAEENKEREFAELSKQDIAAWEAAAYAEVDRIQQILLDDMPDWVEIEKYDTNIGKHKYSAIQIRHESVSCNSHHEKVMSIHVNINKEYRTICNLSQSLPFGNSLYYTTSETSNRKFETIEDAVSDPSFKHALRKKVIKN